MVAQKASVGVDDRDRCDDRLRRGCVHGVVVLLRVVGLRTQERVLKIPDFVAKSCAENDEQRRLRSTQQ